MKIKNAMLYLVLAFLYSCQPSGKQEQGANAQEQVGEETPTSYEATFSSLSDTAIARANDTRYGLSGGLVSDDDALWVKAHHGMRAGILNRNRPTAGAAGNMPFGGPGLSGNFRPGAYYAADYCAWPQASQVSDVAVRMGAQGFPK